MKKDQIIPEWEEKASESGFLINFLSLVGLFIIFGLIISIKASSGDDSVPSFLLMALAFGAFYFIKRSLKSHFNKTFNEKYSVEKKAFFDKVDNTYGKARIIYINGDVYEGECKQGLIEGKGKMEYDNGDIYEGDFSKGDLEGKGKMEYDNGDIYEGNFSKGDLEGKGKMKYDNGDIYEGEFKDDLPHGYGTMTWRDGSIAKGNWTDGKFNS
jgi:hypothetical protein